MTDLGRVLARLPISARLGKLLVLGRQAGVLQHALPLAAMLAQPDPRGFDAGEAAEAAEAAAAQLSGAATGEQLQVALEAKTAELEAKTAELQALTALAAASGVEGVRYEAAAAPRPPQRDASAHSPPRHEAGAVFRPGGLSGWGPHGDTHPELHEQLHAAALHAAAADTYARCPPSVPEAGAEAEAEAEAEATAEEEPGPTLAKPTAQPASQPAAQRAVQRGRRAAPLRVTPTAPALVRPRAARPEQIAAIYQVRMAQAASVRPEAFGQQPSAAAAALPHRQPPPRRAAPHPQSLSASVPSLHPPSAQAAKGSSHILVRAAPSTRPPPAARRPPAAYRPPPTRPPPPSHRQPAAAAFSPIRSLPSPAAFDLAAMQPPPQPPRLLLHLLAPRSTSPLPSPLQPPPRAHVEAWAEPGEAGGEAGSARNAAERLRAELHSMRMYPPEQSPPYAPPPFDAGGGGGLGMMPPATADAEPQQGCQHRSVAEAAEAAESTLFSAATAATEAGEGMNELLAMELDSLAQRLAALRHSPAELYGRYAPSSAAPDGSAVEPRAKTLPPGARFKRGRPRSAGSTQKAPPPAVRA